MKAFLTLCCSILFVLPLSGQRLGDLFQEQEYTLHRYVPEYVQAQSLLPTLNSLFGRTMEIENRQVMNLNLLDNSVVIYETPENLQRILAAIAQLDSEGVTADEAQESPRVGADQMVLESYLPKNLQPD